MARYMSNIEPTLMLYLLITAACILPAILLGIFHRSKAPRHDTELEGCRRLGLYKHSNLADERDERYSRSNLRNGSPGWKVKSLWIYPVKSCKGVELSTNTIRGRGMDYDRQFSFAQLVSKFPAGIRETEKEKAQHTWKFITQRTFPAMANIKTEIWAPDSTSPTYSKGHSNVQSEGVIVLKFPFRVQDGGSWRGLMDKLTFRKERREKIIHIPFNPTKAQIARHGYTVKNMEIWKDSPPSLLISSTEDPYSWTQDLRSYLGITNHVALFRLCSETPREVYRSAPPRDKLGYQSTVGFQDAYPLHILNLASVHNVAKNMEQGAPPIGARNFRPNIVITGGDAYAEDHWKRIRIADYEYYVACRTVRCLLPNVNPATGVRHGSEPNRTLKSLRRVDKGDPKNACLGMQMVPALEESMISVGNPITVLETGEHFYIKQ